MKVEELEPVDYLGYLNDMRRITHEVEGLEIPPEPSKVGLKALDVEIQELERVKKKVNNR